MKKIRIGYISTAYTSKRNFLYATDHQYINLRPFYRLTLRYWIQKLFHIRKEGFHAVFFARYFYDVAHFFNTISFDKHPWITTGGGAIPYFCKEIQEYLFNDMDIRAVQNKELLEKGIAACASSYCKALFVNSYCSLDIEKALVSNFPQYEQRLLSKLSVLYPPQELIIHSVEEKYRLTSGNDKLTFIYVGHDFYRKGGLAVLRCFEKLSSEFDNFHVITIGALRNDVLERFDVQMEEDAIRLIKTYNGTWLTHYYNLPNAEVLELMKKADIGLLPTYSDVFGYSVLEMQACGCPVITSDVRAMPEINNSECGWLLNIGKKTKHRELANIQEVIDSREMEYKLEEVVRSILTRNVRVEPSMIQACISRIATYHSPVEHRQVLETAYQKVFQ